MSKNMELHFKIATISDATTELVLTRKCADVSRIAYLMRCCGDRVSDETLKSFDDSLRSAVESALRCDIEDEAWTQATTGVKHGGLGMRTASRTALAAACASLIGARPLVYSMIQDMVDKGLAGSGILEGIYDERLRSALARLKASAPASAAARLDEFVVACHARAQEQWAAIGGDDSSDHEAVGSAGRRPGHGLVDDLDAVDNEMSIDGHENLNPSRVQQGILRILDQDVAAALSQKYVDDNRPEHQLRLDELRDSSQCHDWL